MRGATAALASAAFGLSALAAAHPFHASQGEVDYRAECRCLEVALRVTPEDLEAALGRIDGRRIPLEAPESEVQILNYLKSRFRVTPPGGEPLPIEWVGREVSHAGSWLYFKVNGVGEAFDLVNRILFEAEEAQVNHLLLRGTGAPRTLSFRAGDPPVRISLPGG